MKKISIWAGGLVLTSIAVAKAMDYFNEKFDSVAKSFEKTDEEKTEEKEG